MKTNPIHSERVTSGLRRSFRDADCKTANRVCYGYTTTADGNLIINETEAKIVRWIFEQYRAGDSLGKIAAGLERMGVESPSGKAKWNREAISKLLSNEKYTGSVLLQKTMSFCGTQFTEVSHKRKADDLDLCPASDKHGI